MKRSLFSHALRAAAATAAGALVILLSGCGQKGPLFLPQEPAAAHRATLPQALFRPIQTQAPQKTDESQPKKAAPTPDAEH